MNTLTQVSQAVEHLMQTVFLVILILSLPTLLVVGSVDRARRRRARR